MGQAKFTTAFSGGKGDLVITCPDSSIVLHFTDQTTTPEFLNLPPGNHILNFKGSAPAGGGITLTISGNVPATTTQQFGSGAIAPHSMFLQITP